MLTIRLDNFSGKPQSLVAYESTATGVVIKFYGPLSEAINVLIEQQKRDYHRQLADAIYPRASSSA